MRVPSLSSAFLFIATSFVPAAAPTHQVPFYVLSDEAAIQPLADVPVNGTARLEPISVQLGTSTTSVFFMPL